MKFGILYNIDYRPEVHGTSSSYYAQILDEVQLLEELGFDSAWFGERHYAGYSFGAPTVIATAAVLGRASAASWPNEKRPSHAELLDRRLRPRICRDYIPQSWWQLSRCLGQGPSEL